MALDRTQLQALAKATAKASLNPSTAFSFGEKKLTFEALNETFRKEMNMSTVEIETGTYIKRFAFWNPATWSIPKLYWDAWSQEQRLHAICRQLEKVIKYADYLGVNVDDIAARLKAIEEGQLDPIIEAAVEAWFEEHAEDITSRITNLEEIIPATEFSA